MPDHRHFAAALSLFAICANGSAQDHWAYNFGGVGNDHVADVKVDAAGFIYVTGEFHGAMTYDGVGSTSAGGIDMFVAKLNDDGSLVWIKHAGGPGIDRAIKLAINNSGDLAVIGEFMGTANFFGASITSLGGTPDMYVALFDAGTGAMQWVRQGGGPDGSDRPYGVAIDGNGNIIVAGEFKGTASWSGSTLTSAIDPGTLLPSIDVVILSYSNSGALNWVQQGSAEFTDRAIDLAVDPSDNIYVVGQFSDTITFDQTHYNAMYNATFILKLDDAGNELWFRRCGGATFNHVRDLQWSSTGELLLAGDLQGTMIFLDNVPNMIIGGDPYAYYLMCVAPNGEYIRSSVTGSTSLVSARSIVEQADTVAVLGHFQCGFTDMMDVYGPGVFLATGDEDLFIARHTLDSLRLVEAQQFGGQEEKVAGQIAELSNGELVFSGSFEHAIIFPAEEGFIAAIDNYYDGNLQHSSPWSGLCGDTSYNFYAADTSYGLKDGFLSRGFIKGRSPYDFWIHEDTLCVHDTLGLCIGEGIVPWYCDDSINFCGPHRIGIRTDFHFNIAAYTWFTGPELDFLWSDGSTGDSLWVTTTGWYWVQNTSTNGCLQWIDSVYVTVNVVPGIPLISDDVVVNTNALSTNTIHLCEPDSAWLFTNALPGYTYWWSTSGGAIMNDSCVADTTWNHWLHVTAPGGCSNANHVQVIDHPTVPMPPITAALDVYFPQDGDMNDSVFFCNTTGLSAAYTASWSVGGLPYTLPVGIIQHFRFNYGVWHDVPTESQSSFVWSTVGWNIVTLQLYLLNGPCADDTLYFTAVDTIYVGLYPNPIVDATISGPTLSCPGDTVTWLVTCTGCMNHSWNPPVLQDFGDSVWVVVADTYDLYASATDTNGCYDSDYGTHILQHPQTPELFVFPPEGIICPDSTAIIYTNAPGTDYQWFGPLGPIPNNNDSVVVGTPGEYYMSFINALGCYMISDPILITGYSTPFLNVTPDAVICVGTGETVTLEVVTTGYSSLVWAPPLFGSSLTQVIGTPGTYSVSVGACGVTTTMATVIIGGNVDASLVDPGPFTLCGGGSILLEALPGMAGYTWEPGTVFGTTYLATQAGPVTLSVFDSNGCADDITIVISTVDFTVNATTTGDTICAGGTGTLTVSGSGTFAWYAQADTTTYISNGTSISFSATTTTVVYVQQSEFGCSGPFIPVVLVVLPSAEGVTLDMPAIVCEGTAVTITANGPVGMSVDWSTPNGTATGTTLLIDPVNVSDQGTYTAVTSLAPCSGETVSGFLAVLDTVPVDLGADTVYCSGDIFILFLPPGYVSPVWSDGSTGNDLAVSDPGVYSVTAIDENGCAVFGSILLDEEECPTVGPNVFTPNGDGVNDGWSPDGGMISGALLVFDRFGSIVYEGDPVRRPFDGLHYTTREPLSEGVYYYVLRPVGTEGSKPEIKGYFQLLR